MGPNSANMTSLIKWHDNVTSKYFCLLETNNLLNTIFTSSMFHSVLDEFFDILMENLYREQLYYFLIRCNAPGVRTIALINTM